MSNEERLVAFIQEHLNITDKFVAILILAGDDAAAIKTLWDLWVATE